MPRTVVAGEEPSSRHSRFATFARRPIRLTFLLDATKSVRGTFQGSRDVKPGHLLISSSEAGPCWIRSDDVEQANRAIATPTMPPVGGSAGSSLVA
jgi:hypothetical protein